MIKEPLFKSVSSLSLHSILGDIFDIRSVKDTMMTVFKKREGPRRK